MPWCESCSKFWNPPSIGRDGKCPTCGQVMAPVARRTPWHFKVMVGGVAVYLGYRAWQGAEWLSHHL